MLSHDEKVDTFVGLSLDEAILSYPEHTFVEAIKNGSPTEAYSKEELPWEVRVETVDELIVDVIQQEF